MDMRKPDWLRAKLPTSPEYKAVREIVDNNDLHTVCKSAQCPNMGECWSRGTATVMILGNICTRSCTFCAIQTGRPTELDIGEPARVAESIARMNLKHAVITSVARDDLKDGGASVWAATIRAIHHRMPECAVEVLTADFRGQQEYLDLVLDACPDIFNHNLETVPRLYATVRPGARYFHSLRLLDEVKRLDPTIFTKSGLMAGLGEGKDEVLQVMDDLRAADVDFLTIGQYLQPTVKHHAIDRFVTPDEFETYKNAAYGKGFLMVSSSPLTRSSYHADSDFAEMRAAREAKLATQ